MDYLTCRTQAQADELLVDVMREFAGWFCIHDSSLYQDAFQVCNSMTLYNSRELIRKAAFNTMFPSHS